MKKYSNIEVIGSINLTGSFSAPPDLILEATASNAVSSSFATTAENLSTVAITNANGNYIDIGNVRYQWGINTNTSTQLRTVTLPADFANTEYVVTANVVGQTDSTDRSVNIGTKTTTNFTARPTTNGSNSASPFNWMAIGLKP
jgi:hypothetical protein